jgi:lipopolysaccharide export system protein LptA
MNRGRIILISLLIGITLPLYSAQEITFKGGFTRAVMREGQETIMLTQGAIVELGSIRLEAENIELMGPNSRYLIGTGAVKIGDSENNITITSNTVSYDRELELLLVDGWVEIQDLDNEVIASGAYLSYNRQEQVMVLQIAAKLLRHTDSGPMVCRADSILYDRSNKLLSLIGNSTIRYKGDTYEASSTTVDLESDEIVMEGSISGSIHG